MLLDLLRQQGIEARIEGEHLQGAMGALPAGGLVRLVADEADHERARAVIAQWETAQPEVSTAPVVRRRYHGLLGFVAGLALGIGCTYAAYRTPISDHGVDYNRDGLVDEKWTFSPNGTFLKVEQDRNLDRKVDAVIDYDEHGLMVSGRSDDNFDGIFESRQRYRNGNLVMSETDTDGDGYPDMRWFHAYGVLDYAEVMNPATGRPLRVEHYRLGKLTYADIDADMDGGLDFRVRYDARGEVTAREPAPK